MSSSQELLFDRDNYLHGRIVIVAFTTNNQIYTVPPDQCAEILNAWSAHEAGMLESIGVNYPETNLVPFVAQFDDASGALIGTFNDAFGLCTKEKHTWQTIFIPSNGWIRYQRTGVSAGAQVTLWQWIRRSSQAPTEATAQALTAWQELGEALHRLLPF